MKKLLLIALLMIAIVFAAVSCVKDDPKTDDTTATETTGGSVEDDTTVADPGSDTTVPEEETTVPEPEESTTPKAEETTKPEEETTPAVPQGPYKDPADAGQKNVSFDTFYKNGNMFFPADGGAGDKLTEIDNTVTFAAADALQSIALRGWIGFEQAIDQFGYYIDDPEKPVYGEFKQTTEQGVLDAGGANASCFQITADLSALGAGEHKVGFIVKLADGTEVILREEIKVVVEGERLAQNTVTFDSAEDADLNFWFIQRPGAGAMGSLDAAPYKIEGINAISGNPDGVYSLSIKNLTTQMPSWNNFFIRGNAQPDGGDGNYFGADGNGTDSVGCAGIYISMFDRAGTIYLQLNVKTLDGEKLVPHIYTQPIVSRDISVADDGSKISIYGAGNLYATIELSGARDTDYGVQFANKAVITLANDKDNPATLENLAVAADVTSDIGFIARTGATTFDAFAIKSLASAAVPTEFKEISIEPINPNKPVLLLTPDMLMAAPALNAVTLEQKTEGDIEFIRLNAAAESVDPWALLMSGSEAPAYIKMVYRTSSDKNGQFFVGHGGGPSGPDTVDLDWAQGDWATLVLDLSKYSNIVIKDGMISYLRIDPYTEATTDSPFDIQYIAFFSSLEAAEKYVFGEEPEVNPWPDTDPAEKSHSFDTFYVNGGMFFPVDGGAADKLDAINNTITFAVGKEHNSMSLRGWIGYDRAITAFGYSVNGGEIVYDASFKQATEAGVLAAGGEYASRFQINADLSKLEPGVHTVTYFVKLIDGTEHILHKEIKVIIETGLSADKDLFYDNEAITFTAIGSAQHTIKFYAADDMENALYTFAIGDDYTIPAIYDADKCGKYVLVLSDAEGTALNTVEITVERTPIVLSGKDVDTNGFVAGDKIILEVTGDNSENLVALYLASDKIAPIADGGIAPIYWFTLANTVDGVKDIQKGTLGKRDDISKYAGIPAGDYKLVMMTKDYEVLYEREIVVISSEIEYRGHVDFVNGLGSKGTDKPFSGVEGTLAAGPYNLSTSKHSITVDQSYLLSISGWFGTTGGVSKYVWTADGGETWNPVISGGKNGDHLKDHFAGLGYTDATANSYFDQNAGCQLVIDLSQYAGRTVDVTFAAVPETAKFMKLEFLTLDDLVVPDKFVRVDTPYYIHSVNAAGALYFDGTIKGGRINGVADLYSAVTIYLEAAEGENEYYIYFTNEAGEKKYIACTGDSAKSFAIKAEKDETCVWIIDAVSETILSKYSEAEGTRGIATQNNSKNNNFSTYDWASNKNNDQYVWAWLINANSVEVEVPDILPDDTFYANFEDKTYYGLDDTGYAAAYTLTFKVNEKGNGTLTIKDDSGFTALSGEYKWTYTTEGGLVVDGDKNIMIGSDWFSGGLNFQADGIRFPVSLVDEIPVKPVAELGDNSFAIPASGMNLFFTATEAGNYIFNWADGETNGILMIETANMSEEITEFPYIFALEANETATLILYTGNWEDDTIDFVLTQEGGEEPEPEPQEPTPVVWNSSDKTVITHYSFDELHKNTINGATIFTPGAFASWDKIANVDTSVSALFVHGWLALNGTIGVYGYQIDDNAPVYNSAFTATTENGVVEAAQSTGAETGVRMGITIDITGLTGKHTVKVLYKNGDNTKAYIWGQFTLNIQVPAEPSTEFKPSEETDGTVIPNTAFGAVFNKYFTAGNPSKVEGDVYLLTDFSQAYAVAKEEYAFTATIADMGSANLSAMFVRGNAAFDFGDGGYFGTIRADGTTTGTDLAHNGCAGIYLNITTEGKNTYLNIRFNCFDGTTVSFKEYRVRVASRDITVVDKGGVVYIMSGDQLAATVTISGTKNFEFTGVAADACAETVVIKTAAGVNETVANAVVAATCLSDIGFATRDGGGQLKLSYVSLKAATAVTVPSELMKEVAESFELPDYTTKAETVHAPISWDSVFKNTENNFFYADGSAADKMTAAPITLDDSWTNLWVRGWVGSGNSSNKIVKLGYKINGAPIVYDEQAYRDAEPGVINAGGDCRFAVCIPVTEYITAAQTYIQVYAELADGTQIEILHFWVKGTPAS